MVHNLSEKLGHQPNYQQKPNSQIDEVMFSNWCSQRVANVQILSTPNKINFFDVE